MKKFVFLMTFVFLAMCGFAFAQDGSVSAVVSDIPMWVVSALDMAQKVPYVGPVVVFILKWATLVAALATALSTCLMAIVGALKGVSKAAGLEKVLKAVLWFEAKILPYFKYLSMYNQQKQVEKKV